MMFCPNCGRQVSEYDHVCGYCGAQLKTMCEPLQPTYPVTPAPQAPGYGMPMYPQPEPKKKKGGAWKIILPIVLVLAAIAVVVVLIMNHVICLNHEWEDATCTEPKTCALCGREEGEPEGHEWQDATCTEPKICKRCDETDGKPAGHTEGDWVTTKEETLIEDGKEEVCCADCGERMDSRAIEKRDPAVAGTSFNFTDEELIDWLNATIEVEVDKEPMEDVDMGEDSTAYFIETEEDVGALILDQDADGNVCVIRVYFPENASLGVAVAAVIAEKIDAAFDAEAAIEPIVVDSIYVKADMVLALIDDDVAVLTTEAFAENLE